MNESTKTNRFCASCKWVDTEMSKLTMERVQEAYIKEGRKLDLGVHGDLPMHPFWTCMKAVRYNPVSGGRSTDKTYCTDERSDVYGCGRDGRLWEANEEVSE